MRHWASGWALDSVNLKYHIVKLRRKGWDNPGRLAIWRTVNGMEASVVSMGRDIGQKRLEDIHAQAIGYVALTGSVEGFPIIDLLDGSNIEGEE